MSTLAIDTVVWVVKMTVTVKNGTGTVTYYFGLDYWPADALYSGSPVIYPLLSKNPTAKRGVGNREGQLAAGLRYDVAIELFGKADFLRLGYGIGDLLNTYEFHGGSAELRCYFKPKNALATHSDATNIRQTLEIYAAKYDDISGLMNLQCRDSWYKDKEFGHRFTTSDFDSNVTDYVNTWRTEMGPIPFGTDSTELRGAVLSVCPLYDSETATDGTHTYQTFKILTGFSPQASSPYKPTFKKLFIRNTKKQFSNFEYIELDLQANGFASRTPLAGPATLDNGDTELSAKQWRLGRKYTPPTGKAVMVSGISLRTKRVGVINHGDGQLQIVFIEIQEVASGKWSTTGETVATIPLDASAIGTTAGDVYFHFNPPVVLEPLPTGRSYLCYAEWTKSSTDDKTVLYASYASPIEITTSGNHGWDTGDSVTVSGVVGNTAANGTFTITKTADDRFTLGSSVGNGTSAVSITDATKRTPIKITTASAHGLATGDEVQVSGVQGNTAANGTTTVKVVSSTEFTLDGTVGNDTYVSGGSKTVNAATNASPIEITTTTSHTLEDNDVVQVSGVGGNTAANGVWRITKVSATKFYLDGSTGNGAYTAGGTVTWGGVVQKKATAERNKRVSLYLQSGGGDLYYSNDQTVNKDGWGETSGEVQLTLWGFGLNNSAGSVTISDYTLNYAELHALASGVVPVPFSGVEFKVGVDGLDDDGSGTYTGSANALIDNPAAVIKFVLMDTVFGLGLDSSRVDTTAIQTVRDDLGSNHDICYALEKEMGCEDFILKICNQSRLVIYKTRQGKITLYRPTYPASYTYNFTEGRLRGEFLLLDVQDNDYGQVMNSFEGTYSLDVLNQNTDAAFNRISRDIAYRGLEYIYGNGTGFTANVKERAAKALDSQRIYGLRSVLMRCDLFDKAAPVQFLLAYLFDRWSSLQRRAKFRVPIKDYYAVDLFSTVRVAAEGIRASTGNASSIPVQYQSDPIVTYSDGVPVNVWSGGIIEGFVVEIEEEGPFMTITVETVSPFPSSV